MENVIWAPWRMEFIEGKTPKTDGCVFCNASQSDPSQYEDLFVLRNKNNILVMMNRFPYVNGHLLVMPNEHVSSPLHLSPEGFNELTSQLYECVDILSKALSPQGFNIGMNMGSAAGAGIADHIHFHIVPRWNGDNNFMPVIGSTRVMPQHILKTYKTLLPHFQK